MRTFGWSPSDEELKDMVNVIDQVLHHCVISLAIISDHVIRLQILENF